MKRNLFFLGLLLTCFMAPAQQESWIIKLDGTVLLAASKEDMAKNQIAITAVQ